MRKYLPHILIVITLIVLSGIFAPNNFVQAQIGAPLPAATGAAIAQSSGSIISKILDFGTDILLAPLGWLSVLILQISHLLVWLSGAVLNYIVQYTVVEMKIHLGEASVINNAWGGIRDVANMGFIFMLLYAAIRTILGSGGDAQKLIRNVVIIAILINFSLFFTKLVIDASNILAITFYDAIAPGSLSLDASRGISNSLMEPLHLTSIMKSVTTDGVQFLIEGKKLIIIGIMGTIVSLIAAFIFSAIAIMFVIRFVVLIFVMILSPLAFLGFVLPQVGKYRDQWWNALSGQAFFAPIYFLLTWIVIVVSRGLIDTTGGNFAEVFIGAIGPNGSYQAPSTTSIGILVNFIIMIVLLITSLVIAKDWANRVPGGINKVVSSATGFAFGGLGGLGRTSFGRLGARVAERADLQTAAKEKTGLAGAGARLALYAGRKARSGTFDARNANIPSSAFGALIEGTAGRTKIGKTLGLNDVNIQSIPVGSFAANQTGVSPGGKKTFIDTRKESEKRIADREKTTDEELRKAKSKSAIQTGMALGASSVQITEMQKIIKDMSNKEIVALDHNTLANEKVAEVLTANHLKAVNDAEKSENEKREIFDKHFAKVAAAVETLRTGISPITGIAITDTEKKANQNIIRNISDKEVEYIPTSIFDSTKLDSTTAPGIDGERSRTFLTTLTQPQVDNLTKGDKLIASEKQAVKDARTRPINEAFTTSNWATAIDLMGQMRPEALVQLDESKLTEPNILTIYRPGLLNKMAARSELTEAKARAIRTAIINAATTPGVTPRPEIIEAASWLEADGLDIF